MILSPPETYAVIGLQPRRGIAQGPCGAFAWLIYWEKSKRNPPRVGTYVMQHIRRTTHVEACDGTDITLQELPFDEPPGNLDGGKTLDFCEAWEFSSVSEKTIQNFAHAGEVDDIYFGGQKSDCTRGKIEIKGWYAEYDGELPAELKPGGVPQAGDLPSSFFCPLVVPKGPQREHSITIEWDCCPPAQPPSTC
jgi:hypothetical protein